MIAAHRRGGTLLGGIFNTRYSEGVRLLKRAAVAERFGRLTFASAVGPWWREQELLRRVPVERHLGSGRRRRAHESGHPLHRSIAVAGGFTGHERERPHRHPRPREPPGGRHRRRQSGVRERGPWAPSRARPACGLVISAPSPSPEPTAQQCWATAACWSGSSAMRRRRTT